MKSHVCEPLPLAARKVQIDKKIEDELNRIAVEKLTSYKTRVTNAIIASVMLAVNETWNIGEKRMCPMLDNLAEWLDYFSEYMNDGVGFEILEKRLAERGLYALYDELVLKKAEDDDNDKL